MKQMLWRACTWRGVTGFVRLWHVWAVGYWAALHVQKTNADLERVQPGNVL